MFIQLKMMENRAVVCWEWPAVSHGQCGSGRSWRVYLSPPTLPPTSTRSRSAGWVVCVSPGSCAGLTWQLVMPACGGAHQPDSSLSSRRDLPSARNSENWPAGDSELSLVSSPFQNRFFKGASWNDAGTGFVSVIRNQSEEERMVEELYTPPPQSVNCC